MLQAALEQEVAKYRDRVDSSGRRIVVCNGTMPERSVLTGAGPLTISRPYVEGNVLDKLPKALQAKAKLMLHEQYLAPTREDALKAYELFVA